MKTSTILSLFALFACVSAEGRGLFSDRRAVLEKAYGDAAPRGGYGPNPPGTLFFESRNIGKNDAKFVVRVANADSVGGQCYMVMPFKSVGFAGVPIGGEPFESTIYLKNLKLATAYACDFWGIKAGVWGPSSKIAFTTETAGGGPGDNVPGVVVETQRKISKDGAKFSLMAANAKNIVSSCATLSPTAPVKSTVTVGGGSPLNVFLSLAGLKPATSYVCTVYATNGKNKGPSSRIVFTTTPPPKTPPPGTPVLKKVSATRTGAAILTTKPARAAGLRANCRVAGKPALVPNVVSVSGAGVSVALKNLKPATSYRCTVYAVNSSGAGPAIVVPFTTQK